MKFTDYILTDAIVPELKATDKEGVIREMVQSLVNAGGIQQEEYEGIVKAFLKREELGSTGIRHGVAIPETKHPSSVKRPAGVVAISTEGIDFNSPDGEKVQLFFMVISPTDFVGHIRVLDHLHRRGSDDMFCRLLIQAKTREAIVALLEEDDSKEKR
jgi:PTS system fructose-specific IIA component/PTS system nitrogen regulatory IIA component